MVVSFWEPIDAADLERSVLTAAIEETTFLDFKRFPDRTDAGRRAIAKDLAAFSVHGGTIVLGVDEPSPGRFVPGAEP